MDEQGEWSAMTDGWSITDIPDLSGRLALVTGANAGLGLETARRLVDRGAAVVMAVRDEQKAAAARSDLLAGAPEGVVEIRRLDLASLDSVRTLSAGVLADHPRIDLLVNNAGVMATPAGTTSDGFETQFGINHLGHFALTALLLPAVVRSPAGRIVNVTSTGRFFAGPYLADPHLRDGYHPWRAYGISKRANLQFALELDRRLHAAGSPAMALAADPGFSHTDLQAASARSSGGLSQRFAHATVRRFGGTPAEGALPQLRAATDPNARGGTLFRPRWVAAGPPVEGGIARRLRRPDELIELWELSERETGIALDVEAMVAEG